MSEHLGLRDNDHGDPDDPQEHAHKHVATQGFNSKHRPDEQGQDRSQAENERYHRGIEVVGCRDEQAQPMALRTGDQLITLHPVTD